MLCNRILKLFAGEQIVRFYSYQMIFSFIRKRIVSPVIQVYSKEIEMQISILYFTEFGWLVD